MYLSSNSSVHFTRLHYGSQPVVILRHVSGGAPTERGGDEFVLEDNGEPRSEEDEYREPGHPDGHVEDEEDLRSRESNAPEEHGLGKTEEKRQILETVDVVPAFGEVGKL